MTPDRRLIPANTRVAARSLARSLEGTVQAARFVEPQRLRIATPVVDLLTKPGGARERQLLLGAEVDCFEHHEGWSFVQARRDGFVGYVPERVLAAPHESDTRHVVSSRATHAYRRADLKSPELCHLSLGSEVVVVGESGAFRETDQGFIPQSHLRPAHTPERDPVDVALRLLGTPYLWGGNSSLGIDCSGLVQAGLLACARPCPGDSDLQQDALGTPCTREELERGDVVFWKGHVGIMETPHTLLHATSYGMSVIREPLDTAITRIISQGEGAPTAMKKMSA